MVLICYSTVIPPGKVSTKQPTKAHLLEEVPDFSPHSSLSKPSTTEFTIVTKWTVGLNIPSMEIGK